MRCIGILLGLLLLFTTKVYAQQKGVITLRLDDGTTYNFDTNEYKIVKRPKPINKVFSKDKISQSRYRSKKNYFSLLGGFTNKGFQVYDRILPDGRISQRVVKERKMIVFGMGYNRHIYKSYSISGIVLSSQTFLGGIGYAW